MEAREGEGGTRVNKVVLIFEKYVELRSTNRLTCLPRIYCNFVNKEFDTGYWVKLVTFSWVLMIEYVIIDKATLGQVSLDTVRLVKVILG